MSLDGVMKLDTVYDTSIVSSMPNVSTRILVSQALSTPAAPTSPVHLRQLRVAVARFNDQSSSARFRDTGLPGSWIERRHSKAGKKLLRNWVEGRESG
jgi:hypothetical protein